MNTKRLSAMAVVLAVAALFAQAAFADITSDMKSKVDSGMSVKDAVADLIASGADPVEVVTAALDAGYDSQSVIDGAVNGETSADVVEAVAEAAVESGKVSADDIGGMLSGAGVSRDTVDAVVAGLSGKSSIGMGTGSYDSTDADDIPGGGAGGGGGATSPK